MAIQSRLPAFLLTRPTAQSNRFAGQLRKRFGPEIEITISPLLTPRFLEPQIPAGPFDALIFSSETGVAAYQAHIARPKTLPIRAYCVGNRTAKAAFLAGLEPFSADGDATALIRLVQDHAPAALLHICGMQSRGEVARTLTCAGIKTDACEMYEQIAQPLSAAAKSLLQGGRPICIPLFSPRSAALFRQQLCGFTPLAPMTFATLSHAVRAELGELAHASLSVAEKPNAESLLDAIADTYDAF